MDTRDLEVARGRVQGAFGYLHIEQARVEVLALEDQISQPDFWNDAQRAQQLSKQASNLREAIADYEAAEGLLEDVCTAMELAGEDEAFAQEAQEGFARLNAMLDQLEMSSWFSGRFDAGDAIVSINPGAGGLEAQDWTEMLYRMYAHYVEHKGWRLQPLDIVAGDGIGLDKATFQVEGRNAYGMLRSESGVHRLVRISPTDKDKRRHTTFAAVQVMPVLPDDIEVDLNPADVRVDVYHSSGAGGQCVNTSDSAVRLTHEPTGIVVTCQDQRSQTQNKEAAFRVLRAKLYEIEEAKRQAEVDELRGDVRHIEFGSQIRNYVLYPYQLVKDVRSGVETSNVDAVLDGDLEGFIIGYHKWLNSQE